ncbi:VTT domain-containing protein [Adhaeribacter swui]|uniref:VTT domain-containing protein n=1 Tax=Adhaeribacter swui TaxID=2086471 RepID=A0A7G7G9X6_9BACT|nr:VTT domain-containing protein [Adhaeribacter swui]QNF33960.1 VTT domain-containing protein [Adhaeribacter swui]
MKRLLYIFLCCCILIIITFLLFGDLENRITTYVHSEQSVVTFTFLSLGFLAFDTLLPVPSSLLMILNGKVLGFLGGSLVSWAGSLVSSVLGFYLGRSANPLFDKFFSAQDKTFSNNFFRKYGNMALLVSKALPILSEAVSFVAGTTAMSFKTFLLYSALGHLIISLVYGYLGSFSNSLHSGLITVIIILSTVFLGWLVQYFLKNKQESENK